VKIKRLFGVGLVGKIAGLISQAGDSGSINWPHGILCWIDWNALDRWHYSASVLYSDALMNFLPSTLHIRSFKDIDSVINGLTEDIAEARGEFPNIRYFRMFPLPTKEHKRRYICEPNRVTDEWLRDSILSDRQFGMTFFIKEEYINGSWAYPKRRSDLDELASEESQFLLENAFPPFRCINAIERHTIAQHVHYRLTNSSGKQVYEGVMYVYDFDSQNDFYEAIKAEQEVVESKGFNLSTSEIEELWSQIDGNDY
jgi:hypothetical protein